MSARLDVELHRRGLARSRSHAAQLITAGSVIVARRPTRKPATPVAADTPIAVAAGNSYVSRAAHKLAGALEAFEADPSGLRVLDAGASTGGFTQVLLDAGAAHVAAVDVGHDQLDRRIRNDERVTGFDGVNARTLAPAAIGGPVDLVVADLSFISLTLVLGALVDCCKPGADLLLMVKPQFELTRADLDSHGVVRSPPARARAVRSVVAVATGYGLHVVDATRSMLPGPSGNVEYFVRLTFAGVRAASMFDLDGFLTRVEGGA